MSFYNAEELFQKGSGGNVAMTTRDSSTCAVSLSPPSTGRVSAVIGFIFGVSVLQALRWSKGDYLTPEFDGYVIRWRRVADRSKYKYALKLSHPGSQFSEHGKVQLTLGDPSMPLAGIKRRVPVTDVAYTIDDVGVIIDLSRFKNH